MTTTDCAHNTDPLKLVREGTSQDGRALKALDPSHAPVNEHGVAHSMVFAQSYAALLKYFDAQNSAAGDWVPFFGSDVSVQLAIAAIEDVEVYKANTKSWFDYLNNLENDANPIQLKNRLGFLFGSIATLAAQLDVLKEGLPPEIALKGMLQNLIRSQLAPGFRRLIAYYKAGISRTLINAVAPSPTVQILRRPAVSFASVLGAKLSADWSEGADWVAYVAGIAEDGSVYGDAAPVFVQINHCVTHNLFTSVFDQFLKVFARVVGEANASLENSLTNSDSHEPHYALYLAFLRLFENARASANTLTGRHLDFYDRKILRLAEKGPEPGHVHLLVELAKQVESRAFTAGALFKGGKDDQGRDVFFANDADLVANQARVAALKTVYRHGAEPVGASTLHQGRIYASPVANSDDGLGAALTSAAQSWHPFHNRIYLDGALAEIRMPQAEIGFAIASHYLSMAEGERSILALFTIAGYSGPGVDLTQDVRCLLTTEKGWLEKPAYVFLAPGSLALILPLSGTDAAVARYSAKTHGYNFQTDLPLLLVKLKHDDGRPFAYPALQDVTVTSILLKAHADNLKTLAVSNDFGPVDSSKPFQPFGPSPAAGNSLVIGSKEIFQKSLSDAWINLSWLAPLRSYSGTLPNVAIDFLSRAQWTATANPASAIAASTSATSSAFALSADLDKPVLDQPDFSPNEVYGTSSRQGFVRLRLMGDFAQEAYQAALITAVRDGTALPQKPVLPTATALSMGYVAFAELALDTATSDSFAARRGQFFHLAPFGTAERHPWLNPAAPVRLLPQLDFPRDNATLESVAEFYVGVAGLKPPQTLSLLFQVEPGSADPMAPKPKPHVAWSYLKDNEWTEFAENEVQDATGELLNSAIVSLAFPRDASSRNTILPAGLHWIRAAVHEHSDAVCRLQLVAAQALRATFVDTGNSPDFGARPLPPGTVTKLKEPDSAVKAISQPFPSFGGRGAEKNFHMRVSERLRHKDRAIALWDYERLVLEAFPQIYKVKCLNHTHYDEGVYRELAPGHVTIVTVPNLQTQNLRDPLKPATSLGVLQQIEAFLTARTGCFVRLHVKNPQFEQVRVRFKVRLYDGFDETFHANLLRQEITRFLSPWAFATGRAPSFGGKIYKSVLIDFVEDQSYVDYVTDFQLFQDIDGVPGSSDLDEVQGSRAVSILVSAPASKHEITIIDAALQAAAAEACPCEA